MTNLLEEEANAKLELAAVNLEDTAGEVSSIAIDKAIVVPDSETDCIHDIDAESTTDEDIVTGVLGHVAQRTVINVILDIGILYFCT